MDVNADFDFKVFEAARKYKAFLEELFKEPVVPGSMSDDDLTQKVQEVVDLHKDILLQRQFILGGEEFTDAALLLVEGIRLEFPNGYMMNYNQKPTDARTQEYIQLSYDYTPIRGKMQEIYREGKIIRGMSPEGILNQGLTIKGIKLIFQPGLIPPWMETAYKQGFFNYDNQFGESRFPSALKGDSGFFQPYHEDKEIKVDITYSAMRKEFISSVNFPLDTAEPGDIGAFFGHVGYDTFCQKYRATRKMLGKNV